MSKKLPGKILSFVLAMLMLISLVPMSTLAAGSVTNYADFLYELKQLETYAEAFYAENSVKSKGELVLNFIRTGVERYLDDNWTTLAGQEITEFTSYVEAQDIANGTSVMNLRDIVIKDFTLPNGNPADFGHMFGTMNISYINSSNTRTPDLSGWAGDLCDLLYYCAERATVKGNTVDEKAAYILENCFGIDADDAFGWDDFYGDMDAYYLVNEYLDGNGIFSELFEGYFTEELDDSDRAAYFLNNRFPGKTTKKEVRDAVYDAYRLNVGIQVLEAGRGVSECTELRKAVCYAFADYLFSKADGRLEGGSEDGGNEDTLPDNGYYSVFSSTDSILAPGVTQQINYAMSADGKQMVYYVATIDVNRDDLTIMANYNNNDPSKGWAMQRVQDQVAAMVKNHSNVENFRPVVAINGDGFNTSTGKPGGLLVMEGVEWHPVDGDGFFAILKDGTAMIGTQAEYAVYKSQIQEAIGAFGATLVKDGKIAVNKNSQYYTSRASRTAIGIKADGSVVMMVLDGRQEPFSCGGSMEEIAQIMYEAGCVHAVNLDGGGSTTYMSKPAGSNDIKVVNRPSDGYARSVAASLVAVSTAKASDEFDHAIIESDYDYLTIGTSLELTAVGVNNIGSSAVIPEGAVWTVSDEAIGEITQDGVFTATDNGDVTVELILDGAVVGSKKLHVVIPDALEFEDDTMIGIFGVPFRLPLLASYDGNPVAFNDADIYAAVEPEDAGVMDGIVFTADEEKGYRSLWVGAIVENNDIAYCEGIINFYKDSEAVFDFENATAGNRTLAWNREVINATTEDGMNYSVVSPDEDIEFGYTFALDMTAIELPPVLEDIAFMLPGSDTGEASAFNYLLQLAERVSVLTEVKITAQFDKDVEVDPSELKIINDYFELKEATVDENNTLTMICSWIDRKMPIPPETANPVCILTGIKAKPVAGAKWTDNELIIINTGTVSYDIYLRATSLYAFAQKAENQQKYGLIPYTTDQTGYEGGRESGAHFANSYAEFEDSFILNNEVRQGWYKLDGKDYYFVNHEALTGIQYIPSKNDEKVKLFYKFDESGVCLGTCTGVIEYNNDLYYAINGEKQTGWISVNDENGNQLEYFFNTSTGKAVDGKQNIWGFNYTFENHILVRGDLVTDSKGTRYRWGPSWVQGKWFEVDGKTYHTAKYQYYVTTGYALVVGPDLEYGYYLFDENGVFQKDYTGLWHVGNDTYLIENGHRNNNPGLVYLDGYYYYFMANAKAVKNRVYWPTITNGLLPVGPYLFDDQGRMVNPPVENPEAPENPEVPDSPALLNGIVEKDGAYFYYENGALKHGAGLKKLTDSEGKEFYIYVRSNGQLATGVYWATTTNGLLPAAAYDFGSDGKYYPSVAEEPGIPDTPEKPEEPEKPEPPALKNGIYSENGKYRYYKDGKVDWSAGVVKLLDETGREFYIYVRSSTGYLATGVYWPSTTNGLLPLGAYDFGSDGRYYPPIVNPEPEQPDTPDPEQPEVPDTPKPEEPKPEVKNGIYYENGQYRYYKDGVNDWNAGLVKLSDENGKDFYIYVRSSTGCLATGVYWPTVTNGLLPCKGYDFGTDGRYYPA